VTSGRRVVGSPGTPLTAPWAAGGLVPRRPSVAGRGAACSGDANRSVDLRLYPRHVEPADHRPVRPQSALDARREAHRRYIGKGGLLGAVL
jgi:hypothetical protein